MDTFKNKGQLLTFPLNENVDLSSVQSPGGCNFGSFNHSEVDVSLDMTVIKNNGRVVSLVCAPVVTHVSADSRTPQ